MNTAAILGCGTRGIIYAGELGKHKEITVTAVCDPYRAKAEKASCLTGGARVYLNEEDFFKGGRKADLLIIATQDKDHYRHAMKALDLGYQLLLEKPVSPSEEECFQIAAKARVKNAMVLVCHVLRYTPFYKTVSDIVRSGRLGRIVNVNQTENVGYWHFSHSFVRGPWRNAEESCPLALAKCCHDLDLLFWLNDCPCVSVSSFGDTTVFKEDNAPKGSAPHCLQGCKTKEDCPFDCEKIYLLPRATDSAPVLGDAGLQLCGKPDASAGELREALWDGPYGRCVYRCDNDVCDHQVITMQWESGATSTLTITPFTLDCYRRIAIQGTKGELFAADTDSAITVHTFLNNRTEKIPVRVNDASGHLGGDAGIINTLVKLMTGREVEQDFSTTIDCTMQSHAIAFAAERSRKSGRAETPRKE